MSAIDGRGRKSAAYSVTAAQLATLQSIARKYPAAMILRTRVGFGVLLAANRYLDVFGSRDLTSEELVDWLGAFKVLFEVDPEYAKMRNPKRDGQSLEEIVRKF